MEIFLAAMMTVAVGVMFRVINLRAAFTTIGLICLGAALVTTAGGASGHIQSWVFWGVVLIVGINILRTLLGALFGNPAADSFTGGLLLAILRPVVALFEGIFRAVFRMRLL